MEEEQIEIVQNCIMYVDGLLSQGEYDVESELWLEAELTRGIADKVLLSKDKTTAHVIDAKFGRVIVEPAEVNLQGQSYVYLLFETYPELKEVGIHFIQPRLEYATTHTYTREDNEAIKQRIRAVQDSVNDETSPANPNEKACLYCAVKAQCPALGAIAMQIQKKSVGLPMPEEFEPSRIVREEDRSKAQVLAALMEDWASQVKKNNAAAVKEQGIQIPGFDLRDRHGGYKVEDPERVLTEVAELYSIPKEALFGAITLSLNKLVDEVKLHRAGDAKDLKTEILERVQDAISERAPVTYLQRKRSVKPEAILEGNV
jgi:CRISPR/Cas system-associated exonuclease Cas4 (RecB family)